MSPTTRTVAPSATPTAMPASAPDDKPPLLCGSSVVFGDVAEDEADFVRVGLEVAVDVDVDVEPFENVATLFDFVLLNSKVTVLPKDEGLK